MTLGLTSFYTYPLTYLIFVDWNALWDRLVAASAAVPPSSVRGG